jgi:hypothetical protein
MADLKFGNVTPAVGNIKLGSNNVSEIYQGTTKLWPLGTPPQPGEVTVCDLVWTKTNSTITATTTGGNIPIVTNENDWITKCQNNEAAACYWQFDSNNSYRGLYYNVFATDVIQPPTGFRLPTQQDWQDLISCAATGSPDGNLDVTSLGNNYYGFWPSNVVSNSRFGTVDFNSIGAGYASNGSTSSPPPYPSQGWFSQGQRDIYHQQQPSLPASYYPVAMFWSGPTSLTQDWIAGYSAATFTDGFATGKNFGYSMRFVKDVVTLDLYDNDTQTGPTVSSITESILSPGPGTSGQSTFTRDAGSVVVPSGGGDVTLFQYLDNSTLPNITDAHFGVLPPNSTAIVGGAINVYPNANRNAYQLSYSLEWSNDNQGGVWSPDGFANRKTGTLTLPQGTWYLELEFFGEKNTSVGQIEYFTGISV